MSRNSNIVVGCVIGGVLMAGLLLCGGGLGLVAFGLRLYEDEVCAHLAEQPDVIGTLGELTSCELDWAGSGEISDKDTMVLQLEGDLGSGRAFVQSTSTGPGGAEEYQGILLEVGGERILLEGREPPTE